MTTIRKPSFRFYDKETHQMLYPFDIEETGCIEYLYEDGEKMVNKPLDWMIQHPQRFIPNQLIYKKDEMEVYEDDVIYIYYDYDYEDRDEPFITSVGDMGEVDIPEEFADFTTTCVKWLNPMDYVLKYLERFMKMLKVKYEILLRKIEKNNLTK